MKYIAALDIETTGLDPSKDKIIEIGVRIFDGKKIVKDWSSLINPFIHLNTSNISIDSICHTIDTIIIELSHKILGNLTKFLQLAPATFIDLTYYILMHFYISILLLFKCF